MIALLDVNLLIALAWQNHMHHEAAHRWFAANSERGWATCPATQAGFVRVSGQPAAVKTLIPMHNALTLLEANLCSANHHFWPQDAPLTTMLPEIKERIMGPRQLSDAILLDLAIRNKGSLVTFDSRIKHLLPAGSPRLECIELITA